MMVISDSGPRKQKRGIDLEMAKDLIPQDKGAAGQKVALSVSHARITPIGRVQRRGLSTACPACIHT